MLLGELGDQQSEFAKPVVGQLTQVLLHMKPEMHTETIEIFHEGKQHQAQCLKQLESTLMPRCIIEIKMQYYGPKKKQDNDNLKH